MKTISDTELSTVCGGINWSAANAKGQQYMKAAAPYGTGFGAGAGVVAGSPAGPLGMAVTGATGAVLGNAAAKSAGYLTGLGVGAWQTRND